MHRTLAAGLMGLLFAGSLFAGGVHAAAPAVAPPVGEVAAAPVGAPLGYYRQPAIHKDTVVFVAEGDLWKVKTTGGGGVATRITSHPAGELQPAISPDGQWLAFIAGYEGPQEVYVMPMSGGLPRRLTWDDAGCGVLGWTADGRVIARTDKLSTLPSQQTTLIEPKTGERTMLPLAQCADAVFEPEGGKAEEAATVFVRIPFNGSWTKRYQGGTIEQLWRFKKGEGEAKNLTGDFDGTSKRPMWFKGRVYFLSDRDGHMNIWSMTPDGKDFKQQTKYVGYDIMGASLDSSGGGKVAYQLQADVHVFDIATGETRPLAITLDSDLDQMRERWVEKPVDWITGANISLDGEKVAITARGRVFVVPHRQGRIVDAFRDDGIRYRDARFIKDSDTLVTLSDKSGEVEVWQMPANGVGASEQVTKGSTVLKWGAYPSPDGKWIAHHNKDHELWVYNTQTKVDTKIDSSTIDDFSDLAWSADSGWLAYVAGAANAYTQLKVWHANAEAGAAGAVPVVVSSDRYWSYAPAWSEDGKWLFFLSDRTFRTLVGGPWGPNQPDPYLDETTKVYALALKRDQRWPWLPKDEVQAAKEKAEKEKEKEKEKDKPKEPEAAAEKKDDKKDEPAKTDDKGEKPAASDDKKDEKKDGKKDAKPKKVEIELEGLAERLYEVPLKAGNYGNLSANDKGLFLTSRPSGFDAKTDLVVYEIKNEGPELKTVMADINTYQMSADTKKLLIRKKDTFYIVDAAAASAPSGADLEKKAVNLAGWSLNLVPRQQWKQMYIEAWRLMRDYFYDKDMHGVDWRAMLDKYLPLVDRVASRAELSDVLAQMVGELSALHHFVRGGDLRTGRDEISFGNLGGVLVRDEANGGWRITRIYQCEPDDPQRVSPLAKPEVACKVGDVIEAIDGVATLSVPDYQQLLRAKAGRQVLLRIKPAKADGGGFDAGRDAIVVPISGGAESDLRYTDWEHSRRLMVEKLSGGRIGYLHLRAMGGGDWAHFVKGFYPVFNREGIILDVRHNRGGNIDSWVLSKLLRKQWAAWTGRVANPPSWNMQYAFRGHMVGLCNERTSSDGETFCEGMRRLNLGKVIGTRTWGGGIWLTSSNVLVDRGLASASEFAVFGPEGDWMVEGRGFTPDIVVDNGPHETFNGEDAQLKAAVDHLMRLMAEKPVPPLAPPSRPKKNSPDHAGK
ncbi:MAG: S41 family peptidase [Phycisphaerales bacterium]